MTAACRKQALQQDCGLNVELWSWQLAYLFPAGDAAGYSRWPGLRAAVHAHCHQPAMVALRAVLVSCAVSVVSKGWASSAGWLQLLLF